MGGNGTGMGDGRKDTAMEPYMVKGYRNKTVGVSRLAFRGLRGRRFSRLAVCAVGGLRGWRFARLAVCAVGGLRCWQFARLAVCAVGGWRVCAVGG